jgi:protease PrsW
MTATSAASAPLPASEERGLRTVRVTAGVLCVFGAAIMVWAFESYLFIFPGATLLAIVLELPLLVVAFLLLRLARPVRNPPLLWSAAATVWGASAAIGCALLANMGLTGLWAKAESVTFAANWSNSLSAPLNEEVLKVCGVIMIVLAAPGLIKGPLDGMVFGALTGIGFQVVENVTYGLDNIAQSGATDPAQAVTSSWLLRLASGLGSHWAMTAVAGTGIGFLVARGRTRSGYLLALACLAAAMVMHALFDAPHPALAIKVVVNFVVVGVLYVLLADSYRARARSVLTRLAQAGAVSDDEAERLLSRRFRRDELRRAGSPAARDRLAARHEQLLADVEARAALAAVPGKSILQAPMPPGGLILPAPEPRHHRDRGAEKQQVEEHLQGHRAAGELAGRVHVAEAHGRERADREVQRVDLGVQVRELSGDLGQGHVRPGEEQDDARQQHDQAASPGVDIGVQQPADRQHDQQAEDEHARSEDHYPGALAHPARHRQQEVDDRCEDDKHDCAGYRLQRPDVRAWRRVILSWPIGHGPILAGADSAQAEQLADVVRHLIGRAIGGHHDGALVGLRVLQFGELAGNHLLAEEVAVPRVQAPECLFAAHLEEHDPDPIPARQQRLPVPPGQGRARDHGRLSGRDLLIHPGADGGEPGEPVAVGERPAGAHLRDISGRVEVVSVGELPAQLAAEELADRRLAAAGGARDYKNHRWRAYRALSSRVGLRWPGRGCQAGLGHSRCAEVVT